MNTDERRLQTSPASAFVAVHRRPFDWTPWVVAVLAVAFFATVCSPILPYARRHDFLSFYAGAGLIANGRLYDLAEQSARERTLVPGLIYIAPYIRPPFYAAVLAPMARLPLAVAFALWVLAGIVTLLAIWAWAYRRHGPDSLVFCSLFLPAAYGIAHGQDCVFLLAILLAASLALERGRDRLAGSIAALVLVKFHLALLLVPAMVAGRRWRVLAGFSGVALIEAAASLAIIGPGGVRQYVALLTSRDLETLSPSPERMINVQALLINAGAGSWWLRALVVGAVVVFTCVVAWLTRHPAQWFWTAIAGSILVAPHAYQYDAALLLPPLLAGIFGPGVGKPERIAAATAALPVVYLGTLVGPPWAAAGALALTVWFVLMGRRTMTQ